MKLFFLLLARCMTTLLEHHSANGIVLLSDFLYCVAGLTWLKQRAIKIALQ